MAENYPSTGTGIDPNQVGATPPINSSATPPADPNWASSSAVTPPPATPALNNASDQNTMMPPVGAPIPPMNEPADPYAAVSPVSSAQQPSPAPVWTPISTADTSGEVVTTTTTTGPDKVVATSHDGGSRRKILMLLGALVLVVVLLIVGSFLYSNFSGGGVKSPSPTPSKAASSPTTAVTKAPTPVPGASLPNDVPPYGSGTLTVVAGPKGQIRTDQKTADPVDKVIEFYKGELAKNGWVVGETTTEGASKKLAASKNGRQLVVQATPVDGQTTIGIVLTNPSALSDTGLPKSKTATVSTASPSPTK